MTLLKGAQKDGQLVDGDWRFLREPIDGVHLHEVRHVPRDHGVITEIYRPEWDPTNQPVVQVYQSRLFPGAIGAWSCHARQTDRFFVNQGHLKAVMYDGRPESRTFGKLMEVLMGDVRPCFTVLPPGVWHGLQNLGTSDALILNCPTEAYNYEDPDHYRLPYDTTEIPYTWVASPHARLRADAKG